VEALSGGKRGRKKVWPRNCYHLQKSQSGRAQKVSIRMVEKTFHVDLFVEKDMIYAVERGDRGSFQVREKKWCDSEQSRGSFTPSSRRKGRDKNTLRGGGRSIL